MAWKQYALNYDPLIAKSRSTFYSQQCPYDGLVNLFEKAKKEENVGNAFDQEYEKVLEVLNIKFGKENSKSTKSLIDGTTLNYVEDLRGPLILASCISPVEVKALKTCSVVRIFDWNTALENTTTRGLKFVEHSKINFKQKGNLDIFFLGYL